MSDALVKLSRIRTALEAAKSIDEMIDIRDQAAAVVTYAKAARLSIENVNAAMEVKLRAERKAGELLQRITKFLSSRRLLPCVKKLSGFVQIPLARGTIKRTLSPVH